MKIFQRLIAVGFACTFVAGTASAAEKSCCGNTKAGSPDCTDPGCLAVQEDGECGEKCSANKMDLKKSAGGSEKTRQAAKVSPHGQSRLCSRPAVSIARLVNILMRGLDGGVLI